MRVGGFFVVDFLFVCLGLFYLFICFCWCVFVCLVFFICFFPCWLVLVGKCLGVFSVLIMLFLLQGNQSITSKSSKPEHSLDVVMGIEEFMYFTYM